MLYYHSLVRVCDNCSSSKFIENFEGFICQNCGMIFEIQRFQFHRPFSKFNLQHNINHETQIGNKSERRLSAHSLDFERLNKIQNRRNHQEKILKYAREEISRFFSCLQLPMMYREFVFNKFKTIYSTINPGTKFRSPDILIPFCIYYCLKSYNIPITTSEIMEVSKVPFKDFRKFTYAGLNFFPEYKRRDRKEEILQKLMDLSISLNLRSKFFNISKIILKKLWNYIKDLKTNVIVGVIAAIATLCFFKEQVRIKDITETLGLGSSTIQKTVKKRIIDKFNILGFKGLVRSSELLREVIEKLNIINAGESLLKQAETDVNKHPFEDITLINLIPNNNSQACVSNEKEIDFLIFHDLKGCPNYIGVHLYGHSYTFKDNNINIYYKLEILHGYFPCKDPPHQIFNVREK